MERTLIAWNVPNLITVPLMAFVGFLLFAVIWQFVMQAGSKNGGNNAGGGGF